MELVGGLWEDRDGKPEHKQILNERGDIRDVNLVREVAEYRHIPKYGVPRWILERWCSPEMYGSPELWEATRDDRSGLLPLGPFPNRGEYEHCFTFEANGQYIPLTTETVTSIVRLIEAGKAYTRSEKRAAIEQAKEKKRKQWEQRVEDIVHDSQDAFNGNARSSQYLHGDKTRTADDIKLEITADQLPELLPRKGFQQI